MISKIKKRVLTIVATIAAIIAAIFWFGNDKKDSNFQKDIVTRGQVKKTVSVTGSLISESPIALNFQNSGRIQEIEFKVGDRIIEGDIIAVLENNILNDQVNKAEAALEKAMMNVKMNDDSTREALEEIDNSEDYLDAVQEYYDQLVDAAEVAYQNAVNYADDAEDYYDQVVSESGLNSSETKSAKLTLTSAENAEEAAEEALETARKNREVNVVSAENLVDSAEEDLETAESNYAELSRSASVEAARADYQIALKTLENASLKSPLNGLISKINYEVGEIIGTATLTNSFGEMITNDFVLEVDVPESDISEIKLDQVAEVTFDAFNFEDKFNAKVVEIEPASTMIQDVVYYKVKLKIDNIDNKKLKEGMSADVDILVDSKNDVIRVSDQFIYENDDSGLKFVKIMKDGKFVDVKVQLGLDGDNGYTEIISGLRGEEEIYLEE